MAVMATMLNSIVPLPVLETLAEKPKYNRKILNMYTSEGLTDDS